MLKKLRSKVESSLVTLKKGFVQNLKMLPGHPSAEVQKIALMGTAHILRKVLGWIDVISSCRCFNIFSEEHIFFL